MKMNFRNYCSVLATASLLAGCGKADKIVSERDRVVNDAELEATRAAATGDNIQGRYVAHFNTLNPQVNGDIPGSAVILRDENRLKMFVRFSLGAPSAAHFQNIHKGKRCPQLPGDDTNGDGYIDIKEAMKVVGPVIVPLDADISSQRSSNRFWPKAFENGSYTWNETTSFKHFWSDLKREDWDEDDNIVKLAEDEGLAIPGKVVLIQGVNEEKGETLPETVESHKRYPAYVTLPVACGIYMPEPAEEGTVYVDQIPPEIGTAPVQPGQDRPAPEGAGETPGSGTVIEGPSNTDTDSNDTTVNESGSSSSDDDSRPSTSGSSTSGSSSGGSSGGSSTDSSTSGSSGSSGSTSGGSSSGGSSGSSTSGGSSSSGGSGSDGGSSTGSTGNYGDDEEEEDDDDDDGGIDWPWE